MEKDFSKNLEDPLSFVVEGNSYIATQGFLLSPQLAVSMMNPRKELINIYLFSRPQVLLLVRIVPWPP